VNLPPTPMSHTSISCYHCHALNTVTACLRGPLALIYTWIQEFVCSSCEHCWMTCVLPGCQIVIHKNHFANRAALRRHARYWHVPAKLDAHPSLPCVDDAPMIQFTPVVDCLGMEIDVPVTHHPAPSTQVILPQWSFDHTATSIFADRCIQVSIQAAINCLVQETLVQSPVSVHLHSANELLPSTVLLFLSISKLVSIQGGASM